MAKTKLISDDKLRGLLYMYFTEVCASDPKYINLRDASEYVHKHGYPNYSYESLRKSAVAKEYINELKNNSADDDMLVLSTYKTIDAKTFIDKNNTKEKLIAAITELDSYYATIAKSGMRFQEMYQSVDDQRKTLRKQLEKVNDELVSLKEKYKASIENSKELEAENAALRQYIDQTIYEGCAIALLKDRGIKVQNDINIDPSFDSEKIKQTIITSDIDIIESMALKFDEDDK